MHQKKKSKNIYSDLVGINKDINNKHDKRIENNWYRMLNKDDQEEYEQCHIQLGNFDYRKYEYLHSIEYYEAQMNITKDEKKKKKYNILLIRYRKEVSLLKKEEKDIEDRLLFLKTTHRRYM